MEAIENKRSELDGFDVVDRHAFAAKHISGRIGDRQRKNYRGTHKGVRSLPLNSQGKGLADRSAIHSRFGAGGTLLL